MILSKDRLQVYLDAKESIVLTFDKEKDLINSKLLHLKKSSSNKWYTPLRKFRIKDKLNSEDLTRISVKLELGNDLITLKTSIVAGDLEIDEENKLRNFKLIDGSNFPVQHWIGRAKLQLFYDDLPLMYDENNYYETEIEFISMLLGETDYEKLLKQLNKDNIKMYSELDGKFRRFADLQKSKNPEISEVLKYQWIDKLYSEYKSLLKDINFNHQICRESYSVSLRNFKHNIKLHNPKIQFTKKKNRLMPARIINNKIISNFNTPENLRIKILASEFNNYFVQHQQSISKDIRKILIHRDEKNITHKSYLNTYEKLPNYTDIRSSLQRSITETKKTLNDTILQKISIKDNSKTLIVSNSTKYDTNQLRMLVIYKKLKDSLNYFNVSEEQFPFRIVQVTDLYEQWVIVQLKSALFNLGFQMDRDFEHNDWQGGITQGSNSIFYSPDGNFELKVYYEKEYNFYKKKDKQQYLYGIETRKDKKHNFWIKQILSSDWKSKVKNLVTKRCPDISIEIFKMECKSKIPDGIITIDPHFSPISSLKKFAYQDNIVSFFENDLKYKDKSKRLVWSSFDVFAGNDNFRNTSLLKAADCFEISLYPIDNAFKIIKEPLEQVFQKYGVL